MNGYSYRVRVALASVCTCIAILLTGCSPKGWNPTPITFDPAIITAQPVSQVVALGQTATFTVTAASDLPLTYQWTENGTVIPGATSASYTTPPAALGTGGSTLLGTFQVVIKNSSSFITSQSAKLEIGPRGPEPGDLRYLLYQQVPSNDLGAYAPFSGPGGWAGNALGTPLSMGSSVQCYPPYPGDCGWSSEAQFLITPSGYSMHYQSGGYADFASDLRSISVAAVVVTSLDLEPANATYAASWVQTSQPKVFNYRLDPAIPPGTGQQSQIQAQAALDGTQSRIITAASFDASGAAVLISYGWQEDTTVYEAQSILVPSGSSVISAVQSAATTLAAEGYFISAFGGNDVYGYILVGMRVQGDTYPRPLTFDTFLGGTVPALNPTLANFTVVAWLQQSRNNLIISEQ
jgi:hypothetical protein